MTEDEVTDAGEALARAFLGGDQSDLKTLTLHVAPHLRASFQKHLATPLGQSAIEYLVIEYMKADDFDFVDLVFDGPAKRGDLTHAKLTLIGARERFTAAKAQADFGETMKTAAALWALKNTPPSEEAPPF